MKEHILTWKGKPIYMSPLKEKRLFLYAAAIGLTVVIVSAFLVIFSL